jgi:hypothetical protein
LWICIGETAYYSATLETKGFCKIIPDIIDIITRFAAFTIALQSLRTIPNAPQGTRARTRLKRARQLAAKGNSAAEVGAPALGISVRTVARYLKQGPISNTQEKVI